MHRCIACKQLVPVEDVWLPFGALCYCLGCYNTLTEQGVVVSEATALEAIKQAIRDWPRAMHPVPERVSNEQALHASGGRCVICAFDVTADDAVFHGPTGRVVCLRCYGIQTASSKPMDKRLRQAIQAVLATVEGQ